MTSGYLDRYGRARSVCHRLLPASKLLLALAVILTALAIPAELWPVQGVLATLVFFGLSLAQVPMSYITRRLAIFLPMLFLLSLSLPLSQGFATGWELMFSILLRSTVAFLATLWLVNVMPFEQLLLTLRRFWFPELLIAMLAFMYRYLFVLWDELDKMRNARRARSFGNGGRLLRWKTSAQLIGMLLIRAMSRAERVHGSMCARGWTGHVRFLE